MVPSTYLAVQMVIYTFLPHISQKCLYSEWYAQLHSNYFVLCHDTRS